MDNTAVLIGIALIIGAVIGGVLTYLSISKRTPATVIESPVNQPVTASASLDPEQLLRIFNAVPSAVILVDSRTNKALVTSKAANQLGLVESGRLVIPQLVAMVGDVNRGSASRIEEFTLKRSPFTSTVHVDLRTQVLPIDSMTALVLAEDVSTARRLDEVRRDFVANVSHELKTPVGALSLLSEAIFAAADDPEEVRHFADRMRIESSRLAHLVTDLVDLSRLQGDDPMQYATAVEVDAVLREAVDSMRTTAEAKGIELLVGGDAGLQVFGVESQLVTAVRNLLSNAVAYSPGQTRVAIGCRALTKSVEITVTDQGIGIPPAELDRIFERFYRIDQARSRQTGGTGLGLSIVKHVCQNHGGSVSVWSVEGEGSTFTLRLPRVTTNPEPPKKLDLSNRATNSLKNGRH